MKSFEKFVEGLVAFRDQRMNTIGMFQLEQEIHPQDKQAALVIKKMTRQVVVIEELLRIIGRPVEPTFKNYVIKVFASHAAPKTRKKVSGAKKSAPAKRKRLTQKTVEKVIKLANDIY